eukprot:s15328_g1.t1
MQAQSIRTSSECEAPTVHHPSNESLCPRPKPLAFIILLAGYRCVRSMTKLSVATLVAALAVALAEDTSLMAEEQRAEILALRDARQLQTSGWVTRTEFNTQVAALQATDYSLGGAMDSAW